MLIISNQPLLTKIRPRYLMDMATLAARLTSVQAAIAKIENGAQSVTVNGRTVTYADLQKLYDQEENLEKRITRAETAGRRSVAEM